MNVGDKYSFEKDGVIYTDTVESVRYQSGSPAIYRTLNWWQRITRRLTPPRWRKSLLVREGTLPTVTINGTSDPFGKTLAKMEQMRGIMEHMENQRG